MLKIPIDQAFSNERFNYKLGGKWDGQIKIFSHSTQHNLGIH